MNLGVEVSANIKWELHHTKNGFINGIICIASGEEIQQMTITVSHKKTLKIQGSSVLYLNFDIQCI